MIKELDSIEFKGDIHKEEDISAIASCGRFLVIGSDESKKKIQVLKKEDNFYEVSHDIKLPVSEGSDREEFDIEGMEIGKDNTLFIINTFAK